MIEVRELTKYYGNRAALSDVSFIVNDGETVGFLGANGAGKSTTMRILTGFLSATSGSAKIAGFDVERDSLEVRRRIGYLPESTPLYRDMRVREFLTYRAKLKGVERSVRNGAIEEAMRHCRLTAESGGQDMTGRLIGHLSKGYRQRVGLADSLLGRPELLILDEPTVGLDPNQVVETRSLIQELGKNRTVFLSTHILHEVELVCNRVVIIDRGSIVAEGDTRELCDRYADERQMTLALLAEGNPAPELGVLAGVEVLKSEPDIEGVWQVRLKFTKGSDPRRSIGELANARGWLVREMRLEPVRLEDIFVKITRGVSRSGGNAG